MKRKIQWPFLIVSFVMSAAVIVLYFWEETNFAQNLIKTAPLVTYLLGAMIFALEGIEDVEKGEE